MTTAATTKTRQPADAAETAKTAGTTASTAITTKTASSSSMDVQLRRIAASGRSPFEQRVWTLLCQIPAGHVTTYGLLAAHLGSSPRAVGNAMRRNPFAPEVPCHRCVATGGGLGGFKGVGPAERRRNRLGQREGLTLEEKRTLLRKEGVRFDGRGRVLGTPFAAFHG